MTVAAFVLLTACAGRDARPVPEYKIGDAEMSCDETKAEMANVESKIQALIPKTKKTTKNVVLGVTGYFLLVPLFFMDFSDAEKVEVAAYQDRHHALELLYAHKHCNGTE